MDWGFFKRMLESLSGSAEPERTRDVRIEPRLSTHILDAPPAQGARILDPQTGNVVTLPRPAETPRAAFLAPELARFDACITPLLVHEGGYVNHPDDPGGCTNMGITIETLRRWRRSTKVTCEDVRTLTEKEARAIYFAHYWNAARCDAMPAGIDYAVFDFTVNSGRKRAIQILQRILRVEADGAVGPITLKALWAHQDHVSLIDDYCDTRLTYLKVLKNWPTFSRGWARRVSEVRNTAILMSRDETG